MNDLDVGYNARMTRRMNILCARIKYTFTMGSTRMVTCAQHEDQLAYSVRLPNQPYDKQVCPKCYATAFDDVKEAELVPVCATTYRCMFEDCQKDCDYHDQCAFCRDYFCDIHLTRNDCCTACLSNLEGEPRSESMRGS